MARARGELVLTLAVGCAAVAAQLPIFDRAIFLLDEGYLLQLADEINRGKVLYRDVNVDAPFPGAFYLLAGWLRVFGTTVFASRLLAVTVFAAFTVLAFRIVREFGTRAWALGMVGLVLCYRIWAFPQWQMLSYSSLAATFLAGTLLLLLVWLGRERRGTLVGAGLFAGAAILCKQDYGLGVSGAFGLALLLRSFLLSPRRSFGASIRPAAWFTAGIAGVVVPVLLALVAAGAFGAFIEQTFVRPLAGASSFPYVRLPALRPFFHQDFALRAQIGQYLPSILVTVRWAEISNSAVFRDTAVWDALLKVLYWAPLLLAGAAALVWLVPAFARGARGTARVDDHRRVVLVAFVGGFLLAFNRPRDWLHLMMMYPAAMLLGGALCAQAPSSLRRLSGALAALGLALLVPLSVGLGADLRAQLATPLAHARAGVSVDPGQAPVIDDVVSWVEASAPPGTPVPVIPIQPMIDFLAAREGAGGFYVIWPVFQDPDRDARIIADMERRHAEVVVYSVSQYAHLGSFRENAPRLFGYLAEHFTIERVFSREFFGLVFCGLRRRVPVAGVPLELGAAAAERGTLASTLWPFARVVAQRVGSEASPSMARVTTSLPAGAPRLVLRYGINPERWLDPPSGPFTFRIVLEAEGASAETLLEATLDPYGRVADRLWPDARLDLSRWAGQRVAIGISVSATEPPPNASDLAGWAEARLVEG